MKHKAVGTGKKAVRVEWVDSSSTAGWVRDFKEGDLRCMSVGFLIKSTKDRVILALNHAKTNPDSWGHYMEIPKCAVKSIRTLK